MDWVSKARLKLHGEGVSVVELPRIAHRLSGRRWRRIFGRGWQGTRFLAALVVMRALFWAHQLREARLMQARLDAKDASEKAQSWRFAALAQIDVVVLGPRLRQRLRKAYAGRVRFALLDHHVEQFKAFMQSDLARGRLWELLDKKFRLAPTSKTVGLLAMPLEDQPAALHEEARSVIRLVVFARSAAIYLYLRQQRDEWRRRRREARRADQRWRVATFFKEPSCRIGQRKRLAWKLLRDRAAVTSAEARSLHLAYPLTSQIESGEVVALLKFPSRGALYSAIYKVKKAALKHANQMKREREAAWNRAVEPIRAGLKDLQEQLKAAGVHVA